MLIGTFEVCGDGYAGRLHTLTCVAAITIVRAQPSAAENAPECGLVLCDAASGIEIGQGWNLPGEPSGAFNAVPIDDHAFALPLRPHLLLTWPTADQHPLRWPPQSAPERSQ